MENQAIHAMNYKFLQDHVYSRAGIVLEHDKHYLFESRLNPIVHRLGLSSINELCSVLLADRESVTSQQVVEAMTTNETYFFREPAQYEAIRKDLLPRLRQESAASRRLRIWSAASSTGQEAYSMAMLLLEMGFGDWNVQILGTDYASHVLNRARSRTYQQHEISRGLPPEYLNRYFTKSGTEYKLTDAVGHMVTFDKIDLRKSMAGMGPFDLVFCRNVLIYFDAETKKGILREIHGTLRPGGWLLLGGAETAFDIENWFNRHDTGGIVAYTAR